MSADRTTPFLEHSDTPQSSPIQKKGEQGQQAPGAGPDDSRKLLVLTPGSDTEFSKAEKASSVMEIVEDEKVVEQEEKQEKKKSKKSASRLFLGYLPTGQSFYLTNCPMRRLSDDSGTDTEIET